MSSLPKLAERPAPGDSRDRLALIDRLDEQKRGFVRMASHELRTPLNSIIGFSQILAGENGPPPGSPQSQEYARHILASGHKLLRLVNQLLEIGRMQSRVAQLEPVSEALDHIIDDVRDSLGEEFHHRGVRLSVRGEGGLPIVVADPAAIRTAMVNLIDNAIRFSPDGGEVRVAANRRGGQVEIEIEDDGPGFEAVDVPRLVLPFEQGENALTRSAGGAGLGLAIVKLLVGAMDGDLRLECAPGRGLKAVIVVPEGQVAMPRREGLKPRA